jgi:uncharacterized BrkB/YihY/UPF0761 family membrane protein
MIYLTLVVTFTALLYLQITLRNQIKKDYKEFLDKDDFLVWLSNVLNCLQFILLVLFIMKFVF